MDHEINMKSFKYVDPVLIEHQCDVSLYNSVYSRFTIKHYCTIDKAYRRNIQFEKVARSPSKLRSLKYMLCPPRYSFRKAHIPDKTSQLLQMSIKEPLLSTDYYSMHQHLFYPPHSLLQN